MSVSQYASTGQFQQQQFYPASTAVAAGTKIFAFVADDPDTLFQVVSCSGTTVVAGVSIAVIGSNMSLIQNAGSTVTGNSAVAVLSSSTATTNSLPIRVIDVVRDTATGADAFVELIVKIKSAHISIPTQPAYKEQFKWLFHAHNYLKNSFRA
jgi:hypothetical protein